MALFDPSSKEPYALSRSRLQLFLDCPRCFYLYCRHGIKRVDSYPFSLNLAVDLLMKKEFDVYRAKEEPHPIMDMYGVEAVPFRHKDLATWRDSPKGIRALHGPSNLELFGLIDDVWQHPDQSLSVVDYKATSTFEVTTLDNRDGYKRQLDVYAWLFKMNRFSVFETSYFVFVNGLRDKDVFDRKLEFTMQVLPYDTIDAWIPDALLAAKECLMHDLPPPYAETCDWCGYRREARVIDN